MDKFRKVCLPCDLLQWTEIKTLLKLAKSAPTTEAFVHRLQKVYNAVRASTGAEADDHVGAKAKSPNVFHGLSIYLSNCLSAEAKQRYLNELLPFIIDKALQIETFSAECDFVVPDGDTTIVLTRACACSLLSCSMLCIFPGQHRLPTSELHNLTFTFERFFSSIVSSDNDIQLQKLQCIFQYYELTSRNLVDLKEEIVFVRQILKNIPTFETWLNCQLPLCELEVICSEVRKVRHNKNGHLILFGKESFGSHVLCGGNGEMDLCFIENPELISAILFFDRKVDNEVIMVRGASRFTTFPPKPTSSIKTLKTFSHIESDNTTTICCSSFPGISDRSSAIGGANYRHKMVVKMAGKMLCAFQQLSMDKSRFEEEEEEEGEEAHGAASVRTSQKDSDHQRVTSPSVDDDIRDRQIPSRSTSLPSRQHRYHRHHSHSIQSACSSNGAWPMEAFTARPLSVTSNKSANSRRADPWRSHSSGSSASVDWTRRTMSFELESSHGVSSVSSSSLAGVAEDVVLPSSGVEEPTGSRRKSLHSSSRRSSGLTYQFSEEGGTYSRRRSSAMSEASQRSGVSSNSSGSSGKRSSSDYSSEMEEYFDSFQRSNIKTSVIEEESSWLEESAKSLAGDSGEKPSDPSQHQRFKQHQFFHHKSPRRFVRDQPSDALRPLPVRPSPVKFSSFDTPMMALDNFTDNLINQIAQDSREEIVRIAKECRRGQDNAPNSSDSSAPPGLLRKFFRRGRSADMFNFKTTTSKETIRSGHFGEKSRTTRHFIESVAGSASQRILSSALSEVARLKDTRDSVSYETSKSLEEFAGDFVRDVFRDAFQVISSRSDLTGVPHRCKESRPKKESFFINENKLNSYSRRENDKRHVCTGSVCFDEEEEEEEEDAEEEDYYEEEMIKSAGESNGCESRLRVIGRSLSSGFKDPVLSDFEDLLVNSSINSPGMILFSPGDRFTLSQTSAGDQGTTPGEGLPSEQQRRQARDSEISSMCSRWFAARSTDSGRYDGYAEKFVVEIFKSAICQLVDNQPTPASVDYKRPRWEATVEDYAVNLVQCILEEAMIDLEKRTLCQSVAPRGLAAEGRSPVSAGQEGDRSQGELPVNIQDRGDPILVGHYNIGIYGDDPEIQAVLYWLCASYMGLPLLVYCSHGNTRTDRLSMLVEVLKSHDWSVGTLFSEVLLWCSTRVDQSQGVESLIEFLLHRRLR